MYLNMFFFALSLSPWPSWGVPEHIGTLNFIGTQKLATSRSGTSSSWHHPGGSNFLLGMKRQPKGTSQGNRSRPSKTNQTGTASGRDPTGLFGGRWTTNRKKPLWGPCYALPCCCKKEMLIQKYRSVAHYLGHCLHLFFPNIPKSLYTLAAFYDLKAKSRFVS